MADTEVICANRQCRVAEDGKCVEGLDDLGTCPFFGREPDDDEERQTTEDEVEDTFDGIRLPDSLALEPFRANQILSGLPSKLIAIIGVYDSGKTSVIAGLHDLFQMGTVSGTNFAGSSTLHGLEMICHDARVASERGEAHSERTKRGEVRFYHMDLLRNRNLGTLLIADRSGEEYEEVADLVANASTMFELRRADVLTILVDGERLASLADRADAIGAIPPIVQGMVENDAFVRTPSLAIVLTKNDVVEASPRKERVLEDFRSIVDDIAASFADSFGSIASFVTSASPKAANVDRGAGLAEVLDFWLGPTATPKGVRRRCASGRVFDRLTAEEADLA